MVWSEAPVFTILPSATPSAVPVEHGMLAEVATVHVMLVDPSTIVVVLSRVTAIASYLSCKLIVPADPSHEPARVVVVIASVNPVARVSFNISTYRVAVLTSNPEPISVTDPVNVGCLSLKEEPDDGVETTGEGAATSTVTVAFCFVPVVAVVDVELSVKSWYWTVIVALAWASTIGVLSTPVP